LELQQNLRQPHLHHHLRQLIPPLLPLLLQLLSQLHLLQHQLLLRVQQPQLSVMLTWQLFAIWDSLKL
jgi:hypothetical protein